MREDSLELLKSIYRVGFEVVNLLDKDKELKRYG